MKLSISQAAKICGFNRTYFYNVIKKYNITTKRDESNHLYIDASELVRALPPELINNDLLKQTPDTRRHKKSSPHQTRNETPENQQLAELIKQNEILIKQNAEMLLLLQKQVLLLEHKTDTTDKQTTKNQTPSDNEITSIFGKLRSK
jgi:hypothetical protein